MLQDARLLSQSDHKRFMLAGNSYFTLLSRETGKRFTYRVSIPKNEKPGESKAFFASLMTGPDNTSQYEFFGTVFRADDGKLTYKHSSKSRLSTQAPGVGVFIWLVSRMNKTGLPPEVEMWHEGRCCRCGRRLTVPESIESGIGPECAGRM